jgi:hypothetical protein
MAVFFLLLTIIVQVGFAVTARSMVAASIDGTARRAAAGGDEGELLERLESEVRRTVPGLEVTSATIDRSDRAVTVEVRYRWLPPGPDLLPIEVTVSRERSLAIPP